MSTPLHRVAFWCWYVGAGFRGYQQQQGLRTVQGELLRAFAEAGFPRNPVVAGRTDRGVSARMQVLSARVDRFVPVDELAARLNARLPEDVRIHLVRPAAPQFHAAFSATQKEYRYVLGARDAGDEGRLREAAALVPGTRNFRVFHFKTSAEQPRTVHSVEVCANAPSPSGRLVLRFVGAAFARHMVRMLVGGMTAVAKGEVPLDTFRAGLLEQRLFHCPTAPPEPLTLWSVGYPPGVDPFTPGEREAFRWPP
ncbi:MAG: tRNA pseudouridine(38-40) synthase TruA [Myxococcales bacterium]|nr:tRNA pseudouridine(38-40) synthase TruA [Myxococcales bacterium]